MGGEQLMKWFDILKNQMIEPHDIVFKKAGYNQKLFNLIEKLLEYQNVKLNSMRAEKMATELNYSLRNAAFFNKPIPTKHRILLRRLIPYTKQSSNEGRIFNTLSVTGINRIRKLPFDLKEGLKLLPTHRPPSNGRPKGITMRFKLIISKKTIKFGLERLQINGWYADGGMGLTSDTAEFIRIWKYMTGYTNIRMDFDVIQKITEPYQRLETHDIYRRFDLSPEFAGMGKNVSKGNLDRFIENVRKHYLDIEDENYRKEAELESKKFAPQRPFDIGYDEDENDKPHRKPKGDEE